MVMKLDCDAPDFEAEFAAFFDRKRGAAADVDKAVAEIIADVRARGDQAICDLTAKFDRLELEPGQFRITQAEMDDAAQQVDEATMAALRLAHERITSYHQKQRPENLSYIDDAGIELGYRWTAIHSAGIYVPGGTAAYPSSVLMNAVPAKVAGVVRLVMMVPAPGGHLNPLVLAAARLAGVSEIYRIGGAQAIAALAFGTKTIPSVDMIAGPGNAYVAAAKRQVFGQVGIDMMAGPSEVLIVADEDNDPEWIAADLLAQAEHDAVAQSILITNSQELADAVPGAVERQLQNLPRKEIAAASWRDYGAILTIANLEDAIPLIDRIAPEHLEIATADPDALAAQIRNAGAIFLGAYAPEAIGDYVAGSNHVLPTGGAARFASGLGVLDFMKRTSLLKCSASGLAAIGPAAIALAEAEGLNAHARSVRLRLEKN